jgi:glycosyltransferase involved in cell wall biosynthesis
MNKRVAINALSISSKPSGGRTYIRNLLAELALVAQNDYQFDVICSRQNLGVFADIASRHKNIGLTVLPKFVGTSFFRVIYEQFIMPLWLWYKDVDLLFACRNVMPLWKTCRTVIGVLSMHLNYENIDMSFLRRMYGKFVLEYSARQADAYLAISEYAGFTYIEKYNLSQDRLFISPLGYKSSPVGTEGFSDNIFDEYLLFVGTLFPHKNVDFLLRVFSRVVEEYSSVELVIIGRDANGNLYKLRDLAQALSITDKVHFVGSVSNETLTQLYANARIFVFPSLIEGFGLPVLEAMAHEVPVIVSNRTAIPEVVGDAGIVLNPENESAWVKVLLQVLENEELHNELSLKSSSRASIFTWRHTAENTLDCFNQVLAL